MAETARRTAPNPDEFQEMVEWAWRKTAVKPDSVHQERRERVLGSEDDRIEGLERSDSSDAAMALWFLHEHSDRVIWVPELAYWMVWDGKKWAAPSSMKDSDGEVSGLLSQWVLGRVDELAQDAYDGALKGAMAAGDDDPVAKARKAEAAMRAKLKSSAKHKAILTMVKVHGPSRVRLSWDDLDHDPEILNCPNGMVNLRTGVLSPHDPAMYCTGMTAAEYAPGAKAPAFLDALEKAQPDADVRAYLARRAGSTLLGEQRDHVFHVDYGERGRNGKGLHNQSLFNAVGTYGGILASEKLMVQKFDPHPEWLMRLRGKRLVWIDEGREQRSFDSARVKSLTGGATRECREMRGSTVYYRPTDTMILSTNRLPKFDGGDEALEGRMRIVNWDVTFIGSEDTGLAARIAKDELEGVLAWMVAGCMAYLRDGLKPPLKVLDDTRKHVLEANTIATWAEEELKVEADAKVTMEELYRRYKEVFTENHPGQLQPTNAQFTRDLKAHIERQSLPVDHKKIWVDGRSVWGMVGVRLAVDGVRGLKWYG